MDIFSSIFGIAIVTKILPWVIIITTIVLALKALHSIATSLQEISTKLGKMNAILAAHNKQQNMDTEENKADSVTK